MDKQDQETLAILVEECAEVIQAVSKIVRFGIDNSWNGTTPRQDLETEIGDVLALIDIAVARGLVRHIKLQEAKECKVQKLHKWSSIFSDDDSEDK